MNSILQKRSLLLFAVYFCIAVSLALIFQKLALPLMPSLHAGSGLMSNDAAYFDSVATKLAHQIHQCGWGCWSLYPGGGAAGNVALLGALYAIFGHDPTLMIPINAGLHALGGVLIYLLALELADKKSVGSVAGLVAATLFVLFPSALNWYGQIHKDGFAIAGTLLIFLSLAKATRPHHSIRQWFYLMFWYFVGVVLILVVRPYNLKLMLVATIGALALLLLVQLLDRGRFYSRWPLIVYLLASTIILIVGIYIPNSLSSMGRGSVLSPQVAVTSSPQMGDVYSTWTDGGHWKWQSSIWIPDKIEAQIETAAKTRAGMIRYGEAVKAKTMIDANVMPHSSGEMGAYVPRALQIALFAPFPSSWLDGLSAMRMIAIVEMFVSYLCLIGLAFLFLLNKRIAIWGLVFFACFFLATQGLVTPNIGTLYRVRYAYFFVMVLLGILGWVTMLDRRGVLGKLLLFHAGPAAPPHVIQPQPLEGGGGQRKKTIGAGMWVMGLTLLSFVGFFIRDVLMARTYGLSAELDNFFIALLIPMFLVTVIVMPLGTAFVPIYIEVKERVSKKAVQILTHGVSAWIGIALAITCALWVIGAPLSTPLLQHQIDLAHASSLTELMQIATPILLFSGAVVLGNSVLNAEGRVLASAGAQLIVPVVAIFAHLAFGKYYGVYAVMVGMVIGQLLNLLIVQLLLKKQEISLVPGWIRLDSEHLISLKAQYFPLIVSAVFISVAAPVDSLLAMSLSEGSVSAFNLGNKIVLFITGIVGTAISTVMLPYFSSMITRNYLLEARRELSVFLLISTAISTPVSIILFIFAPEIVSLLLPETATINSEVVGMVTRVMQYSVMQLPFFVCNTLLLKFATATRHVHTISLMAGIGLVVNIGASVILMPRMGVAGIALGASLSMLVATAMLVLSLFKFRHLSGLDALVALVNWLMFVTLLIGVHFQSLPSIFAAALAYVTLIGGYIQSLGYTYKTAG